MFNWKWPIWIFENKINNLENEGKANQYQAKAP